MQPKTANLLKQVSVSFVAGMVATAIYNRTMKDKNEAQAHLPASAEPK